jgi:hypothetical protein
VFIAIAIIGFFNLPIFMLAYEMAVVQTQSQGVSEALSCGLINTLANSIAAFLILMLTPTLSTDNDKISSSSSLITMLIMSALLLTSFVLMVLVKAN